MIIINIKERKADINKVNELSNKYNISKDIIAFLLGRNIPEDIIPLLVSKEELPLLPNDTLSNVKEAAELINKYLVNNNANIYIFGDYDSDGVNATYIMYTALSELAEALESGVNIKYYLPNRDEGYGLNMDWCESIDKDSTLVITVDNGISKVEEVEYLKANNVEVLIKDKSLITNAVINYKNIDKDEFIKIDPSAENLYEGKKIPLSKLKNKYKNNGAKCRYV